MVRLLPSLLAFTFLTVSLAAEQDEEGARPPAFPTCKKPSVRKEWRKLKRAERAEWIGAAKCLGNLPHDPTLKPTVFPDDIPPLNTSGSYHDDIVYLHMDLNPRIHTTGLFLPWHRWYVHAYDRALRTKCGFKGVTPYWDWTIDAPDFEHGSIWQDPNPVSGLGGWGDPNEDWHVHDGAFGDAGGWKVSYPVPHTLRRKFELRPFKGLEPEFWPDQDQLGNVSFTKSEAVKLVNGFKGDFVGFVEYYEAWQGAHTAVHLSMGGDLSGTCPEGSPANCTAGPRWSPNDPMFFMLHGFVDKLWFEWQHKHPANRWAFHGGASQKKANMAEYKQFPTGGLPWLNYDSPIPSNGMKPTATIADVIDTTGGLLCYVYE